jgi:hypothetical protein
MLVHRKYLVASESLMMAKNVNWIHIDVVDVEPVGAQHCEQEDNKALETAKHSLVTNLL